MARSALRIILPMAGNSQRFKAAGVMLPKALIPIDGMPMFLKALSSAAAAPVPFDLTVVTRADFPEHREVPALLREAGFPAASVVEIHGLTRGAAETAAIGLRRGGFADAQGLIVLDTDIYFESSEYWRQISASLKGQGADGGVLYFQSTEPRYSFVQVDAGRRVTAIAEKQVISDRAVAGAYYFRSCGDFLAAADTLLEGSQSDEKGEMYISRLIAEMLRRGRNFFAARCDAYDSFGTPEELASRCASSS